MADPLSRHDVANRQVRTATWWMDLRATLTAVRGGGGAASRGEAAVVCAAQCSSILSQRTSSSCSPLIVSASDDAVPDGDAARVTRSE